MSELIDVLSQDIEAILAAFNEENYGLMNILSNRFMANATFLKNGVNFLPGFIYKDISQNFRRIKNLRTDTFATAKADCRPILEKIKDYYLDSEREPTDLWFVYLEYYITVREHLLSDIERKAYGTNLDYTRFTFTWLLEFLNESKDLLLHDKNRLLNGILNEMDRTLRCHSGRLEEIVSFSLLRALTHIYTYQIFEGSIDERKKIFPLLDDVISVLSEDKINLNKCLEILSNILSEWRKYYMRYMEVKIMREISIEKGFELPEDVKEKISESISKTLGEEIE